MLLLGLGTKSTLLEWLGIDHVWPRVTLKTPGCIATTMAGDVTTSCQKKYLVFISRNRSGDLIKISSGFPRINVESAVSNCSHWLASLLGCHPAPSSSFPEMKVRSLGCADKILAELPCTNG